MWRLKGAVELINGDAMHVTVRELHVQSSSPITSASELWGFGKNGKARAHRTRRTQENGVSTATAIRPVTLPSSRSGYRALDRETRAAEDADNAEKRSAENAEKRGEVRDPRRNLAPAADDWGMRIRVGASCVASLAVAACAGPAPPRDDGLPPPLPRLPRPDRRGPRLRWLRCSAGSVRSACSLRRRAARHGRSARTADRVAPSLRRVGDTRPATVDDTGGYPADVITTIYAGIHALEPRPAMVLSTGDYMFASASPRGGDSQAGPQLDIYMQARARSPAPSFRRSATTSAPAPRARTAARDRRRDDGELRRLRRADARADRRDRPYYAVDLVAGTPRGRRSSSSSRPTRGRARRKRGSSPPREADHVHLRGRHEPASATSARA